jgi:methyl-accepting chemotaxis protein
MSRTSGAGHAEAVRRAKQVAARRAEVLREREEKVTATLVAFFDAKARADKIRSDAADRAARLLQAGEEKAARLIEQARTAGQEVIEQAEKNAAGDDAQVGETIRQLRELGESAASICSMTGLSQAVVRAVEREHLPEHGPSARRRAPHAASTSRGASPAVPE